MSVDDLLLRAESLLITLLNQSTDSPQSFSLFNLTQTQPFIIEPQSTIDRETPLIEPIDEFSGTPQQGYPQSSNIMQYLYFPAQNSIIITFSNMKDYQYWDVSEIEFQRIVNGDASCVTKGSNQFGTWYVGKSPSVGAAVYIYLVKSGKPWRKL